jgi:hypothetical protein
MDILSTMNKINSIGKYLILTILVLNLFSVSSATGGLSNALKALCLMSQQFLGMAVMILIVLAGTIYAIGQILGAETRARAAVWATAMLTGAIIGVIIYIVTPAIVKLLMPPSSGITISDTNPCGGT